MRAEYARTPNLCLEVKVVGSDKRHIGVVLEHVSSVPPPDMGVKVCKKDDLQALW